MPALISAEQESAIARRSEPLLLAAGAGSGKTAVLVERFVRAVLEDSVSPSSIMRSSSCFRAQRISSASSGTPRQRSATTV